MIFYCFKVFLLIRNNKKLFVLYSWKSRATFVVTLEFSGLFHCLVINVHCLLETSYFQATFSFYHFLFLLSIHFLIIFQQYIALFSIFLTTSCRSDLTILTCSKNYVNKFFTIFLNYFNLSLLTMIKSLLLSSKENFLFTSNFIGS